MKRIGTVFFILSFLASGQFLPAEVLQGPKISAKEIKHDFGKVAQGSEVTHVFEFVNAGSESLVIERVVPS